MRRSRRMRLASPPAGSRAMAWAGACTGWPPCSASSWRCRLRTSATAGAGCASQRRACPAGQRARTSGPPKLICSPRCRQPRIGRPPQGLSWQLAPIWSWAARRSRLRLDAPCCTPPGLDLLLAWQPLAMLRAGLGRRCSAHGSQRPARRTLGLALETRSARRGRLQLRRPRAAASNRSDGRVRLLPGSVDRSELQALDPSSSPARALDRWAATGAARRARSPAAAPRPRALTSLDGALRLSGERPSGTAVGCACRANGRSRP